MRNDQHTREAVARELFQVGTGPLPACGPDVPAPARHGCAVTAPGTRGEQAPAAGWLACLAAFGAAAAVGRRRR